MNFGANVRAIINITATAAEPTIRIEWKNMAVWHNVGASHTVACLLYPNTGNIAFISGQLNNAMLCDQITGIAPGSNIFPPLAGMSAQLDLSAMAIAPVTGAPRESFSEWFGLVGMTDYLPVHLLSRPYDLTDRTVSFFGVGTGSPGAYYVGG